MDRNLLVVIIVAVLFRLLFFAAYRPAWVGDSGGYTTNGFNIINGNVLAVDGGRTPAYPMFVVGAQWLSGSPIALIPRSAAAYATYFLQALCGIISTALLYLILKHLGCGRLLSLGFSLAFAVTGAVALPETQILPQALETSLLVLAVWLLVREFCHPRTDDFRSRWLIIRCVPAGFVLSVAVLTRPDSLMFLIGLSVLLLAASLLPFPRAADAWPRRLRAAVLAMLAGAAPLVEGWMTFNYFNQGYFAVTTLGGFVQTSALRDMFGRVGPEDRVIGDIINRRYLEVQAQHLHWPDYITSAWPQILAKSGEMPIPHREPWHLGPDLSHYMGQVSYKLIRRYPLDWLRNAAENFCDTFSFAYLLPGQASTLTVDGSRNIRDPAAERLVEDILSIEAPALDLLYVLTMVACVGLFGVGVSSIGRASAFFDLLVAAIGVATLGCFVGYTLFACYLSRYGISYIPAMFICVAYAAQRCLNSRRA